MFLTIKEYYPLKKMSSTNQYKGDNDKRRPGRYKGKKSLADPERMRSKVSDKRVEYGKHQTADRKSPIFEKEEEKHQASVAKSKKGEETDPDKKAEKKKREATLRKKLQLEKGDKDLTNAEKHRILGDAVGKTAQVRGRSVVVTQALKRTMERSLRLAKK